ncbi:MAG: peptidyl-prolyl cis-trans isomerase [Mycobacterium sp.]|nr:peptidyl-prolyl cis-trans isomerase [Mycobacterium sp.]
MNENSITALKRQLKDIEATLAALEPDKSTAPRKTRPTVAAKPKSTIVDEDAAKPTRSSTTKAAGKAQPADVVEPAPEDIITASSALEDDADESSDEPDPDLTRTNGARLASVARRSVPRSVRARLIVAAALVVAIAGSTTAFFLLRSDQLPHGVAFRVFGHNVSTDRLNAEADTLTALYGITAPTDAKKLPQFRRDIAKAYAVSLIIDKAAASRHIVVADKAAQDVLTRYITQQFGSGAGSYDKFVQALGGVGTSEPHVLAEIKRQLALSQLFDQVTAGVVISASQLRAAFTKNKAALAAPEQRDINNIVVATEFEAKKLRALLAGGGSFATLASEYSLDASTKSKRGNLGKVQAADLEPGYAKVAFAATAGTVFGPVHTQYGWNVGEVVMVVAATPAVFSKVETGLNQQLQLAAELVLWRTWLGKQIAQAHVNYAPTYRPADPNAAPTGAPGQVDVPASKGQAATTAPAATK